MTAIIEQEPAALSEQLQGIARRYVAARQRTNEAFLDAAQALAEARAAAQHGEWYTFLAATNTSEDLADRLLAIAAEAQRSPQFAETVAKGWLPMTQAALVARPSTPPAAKAQVIEAAQQRAAARQPPQSSREVERTIQEAKGAPDKPRGAAGSAPAKAPLTLTPLTPATPAGAPAVIATVPAGGGMPPLLQLGAPAALPPPLFAPSPSPPPGAAAATPPSAGTADGEQWVEVDDERGAAVMVRAAGLTPVVADAIAQVADALRLIGLAEAHAVDTQLLQDMARTVEREPGQRRGTLRTVLRLVADEADELAREALRPAPAAEAPLPAPARDWDAVAPGLAALVADLERAERELRGAGPNTRRAEADRLTEALDGFADALDDADYEALAHRVGALRAKEAA